MQVQHRTAVSEGGGTDFVISDGSLDRHGTRINPKGWALTAFNRNPIALFGHSSGFPIGRWENVRVQGDKLVGRLVLAAAGTSARIDELRQLVEQGILRAVSVGFSVLEYGQPGKSEFDFEKQELVEVSLVSVPSNTNALAKARALNISDETLTLAFGEHADMRHRDGSTSGEQAEKQTATEKRARAAVPARPKATPMKTLAERIQDAQNDLNAARDALTEHLADDNADTSETETLSGEIEAREERLASLQRAEKALAARTVEQRAGTDVAKPAVRKPLGVKLREPKPGDLIVRAAVVNAIAYITGRQPDRVLEERYGDHEATNVFVRAAVDPAKTTVSGWAAELIETETVAFMETLRPLSVFARLAELGTSLSFGPGRGAIKIPSRSSTPSVSGSFVAEGSPIPVRRFGLTSATLSPHKMGVISYWTRELALRSNPQIEAMLRQEIVADTAVTLDTLLLDATAGSTTRPAGLINGVSAITASTAGGWAAILEDINALAAPFDTANAGRRLALLMNPQQARMLATIPGPDGKMGWASPLLEEFTVIRSTTVPAGDVFLIDAADFAAANGTPEFDVSEQAVIHAEDTSPAQIGTAGSPNVVAAPVVSMFQTASIALRMLMDVTWAMRRTGMVQWVDGADWSYVNG